MNTYDVGAARRAGATFKDIDGIDTDPSTVVFDVVDPSGTNTAYTYPTDSEVVKTATGVYYLDLVLSLPGHYIVQWAGTGTVEASGRYEIYARRGI